MKVKDIFKSLGKPVSTCTVAHVLKGSLEMAIGKCKKKTLNG